MSPHLMGGGHIVFGVDLIEFGVGVDVGIGVVVTLSCRHYIL